MSSINCVLLNNSFALEFNFDNQVHEYGKMPDGKTIYRYGVHIIGNYPQGDHSLGDYVTSDNAKLLKANYCAKFNNAWFANDNRVCMLDLRQTGFNFFVENNYTVIELYAEFYYIKTTN